MRHRTLSALVLVPLVLGLTVFGGWPFAALWVLAGLAILYEWSAMARLGKRTLWLTLGAVAVVVGAGMLVFGSRSSALGTVLGCAAVAALLVPRQSVWSLSGVLVAAAAALPIIALRGEGPLGLLAVLFIYAVVWATDIFAYFVGRALGGPKLWPRVSPNKTWSGAIGGAVAGVVAGVVVVAVGGVADLWPAGVIALALSAVSQAGDLAESAVKRRCGVKDASRLIPGHGGILDRLDGFAAAALAALLLAELHGGMDPAAALLLW
ncbi:phosphatidate cytidylyltransferase [Xanthobacter agilis]|uniref:Phosphatidate cytidylyltransferase n=1 Tax=Xanthobacter agilis TaxID=47492 RepID=A0ABU0LIU0_XANAG|nr:phosphatidate cytidylyltransferase [Xanthobacter agilis]MDQ0507053.1 phosphatidate cytidylyltransferase [Xanthobacter agilis]